MLFGKKKKITNYLQERENRFSTFDLILKDYLSGNIIVELKKIRLSKIKIHIDWFDNFKVIGIQAKYKDFCLDIQIDEKELAIGCSKDEPDCDEFFAIDGEFNSDFIYGKIQNSIKQLQ